VTVGEKVGGRVEGETDGEVVVGIRVGSVVDGERVGIIVVGNFEGESEGGTDGSRVGFNEGIVVGA